jgi:hypothetical protein
LKVETAYPSKHLDDAVAVSEFHLKLLSLSPMLRFHEKEMKKKHFI